MKVPRIETPTLETRAPKTSATKTPAYVIPARRAPTTKTAAPACKTPGVKKEAGAKKVLPHKSPMQTERTSAASPSSRLLRLPAKLRLLVINCVLDDLPRDHRGNISTHAAKFPPPILQTCRLLRNDGLTPFLNLPRTFIIQDLDSSSLQKITHWRGMIDRENMPRTHLCKIGIARCNDKALAEQNLWEWLEKCHARQMWGVLLKEDSLALKKPIVGDYVIDIKYEAKFHG